MRCSGVASGSVAPSIGSGAAAESLVPSIGSGAAAGSSTLSAGLGAPSRCSAVSAGSGAPAGPFALPEGSGAAASPFGPFADLGVTDECFRTLACSEFKVFLIILDREKAHNHYKDVSSYRVHVYQLKLVTGTEKCVQLYKLFRNIFNLKYFGFNPLLIRCLSSNSLLAQKARRSQITVFHCLVAKKVSVLTQSASCAVFLLSLAGAEASTEQAAR